MTTSIPAAVLDQALADISDVPEITTDERGALIVTFSGDYESPVNDLMGFLSHLQHVDPDLAEAAREGLSWQDGGYAGYGQATLNGLTLDGTSRYEEVGA